MKLKLAAILLIAFYSSVLISCGGDDSSSNKAESNSTFDLAAAREGIEAANAELAALLAKGDSAGIASLYTSDAKLMGGNMPAVSGTAAIASAFGGMLGMGIGSGNLTTTEVWGMNDMAVEEGTYSLYSKDGAEIDKGKYLVLWKQEGGKWKLFRDCFNSDTPLPQAH